MLLPECRAYESEYRANLSEFKTNKPECRANEPECRAYKALYLFVLYSIYRPYRLIKDYIEIINKDIL